MIYEGDIFRPPSEAYSLIVQVTIGCTHNKCTFCSAFSEKHFRVRPFEDVKADFLEMRMYYRRVDRIFLADANAMCLSFDKLMRILNLIKELFPECQRVSAYSRAGDGLRKSPEELKALKEAGLGMVYIGAESGSPQILKMINKGEDRESLIAAVRKYEDAGILTSITFITGLGGKALTHEHAQMTASMINEMRASYVSLLTLMIRGSEPMYQDIQSGKMQLLSLDEILDETKELIEGINLPDDSPCVYRSNHASNFLVLKGDLPRDKERFLEEIEDAKNGYGRLRLNFMRRM